MLNTAKFVSLGVLLGVSVVSGVILPFLVHRLLSVKCKSAKFQRIRGLLNCFSGGVFLSTTLLTLLPEGREAMSEVSDSHFPFTELLTVGGYLLILFIENVASTVCHRKHEPKSAQEVSSSQEANTHCSEPVENNHASYQEGNVIFYSAGGETVRGSAEVNNDRCVTHQVKQEISTRTNSELCVSGTDNHEHVHRVTNIRDLVLLIALSIHMLFDGLGVGLVDEESKVWSLLAAVSIHRVLIFFSTGLTLCENNNAVKFLVAMLYMCLVAPIGLGIGIAISSHGEGFAMMVISAVLQGVAVGTFLYVAICEILTREFENHGDKREIQKTFAVALGCVLLALINYFTEHE